MTKKRKSFLLHIDSLDILDDLEDQQVANLFRAIKAHQNEQDYELDSLTKIAFVPFKNQFERDQKKYEETCKRRAEAGSKGGLAKVANASKSKQKLANLADSDNKNKSKNNSDSNNISNYICQQVADAYNASLGSHLGVVKVLSDKRKAHIKSSIKQFEKTDHDFSKAETWTKLFGYIQSSDFLMGRTGDWSANFDFIVNKTNLIKIVEGQYENNN